MTEILVTVLGGLALTSIVRSEALDDNGNNVWSRTVVGHCVACSNDSVTSLLCLIH